MVSNLVKMKNILYLAVAPDGVSGSLLGALGRAEPPSLLEVVLVVVLCGPEDLRLQEL